MASSFAPLISVVMPVYNGDDYFELALRSVLNQTWSRFEVVVIDDGSSDPRFVERLCAAAGPRVVYRYQENTGVAGALNHGIAIMQGDVFCWLSHDDLFHPLKLARQVDWHAKLGQADAILFSDYNLIDAAGAVTGSVRAPHDTLVRAPQRALLNGCINGCTIYIPAPIVKSSAGFDVRRRYTQDYHFWNKLLRDYDFFHQPEVLVDYRVHGAQGSNSPNAIAEADDLWIAMADDRSEFERVSMYGSSYQFFAQLAEHLAASPYRRAEAHFRARAADAVASSSISIILTAPMAAQQIDAFKKHMKARRKPTEFIWRDQSGSGFHELFDERVFEIRDARSLSQAGFLNTAVDIASGDYVTFTETPSAQSVERIASGLVAAHQQGATIGLTNLPPRVRVEARDLLVDVTPSRAYDLTHWLFHRVELLRAPPFEDDLLAAGHSAMLARMLGNGSANGFAAQADSRS